MNKKRKLLLLSVLFGFILISLSIVKIVINAQPSIQNVEFEQTNYSNTYSIGDTINIHKIKAYEDGEELEVYALLQKDLTVLKECFFKTSEETFYLAENGEYSIVYVTFDTYGYRHTINYNFVVGDYDRFDVILNDSYSFSDYISNDVEAIIDGERISATMRVIDPLGKEVSMKNGGFYPSIEGTYTIHLIAEFNHKKLENTYTFIAVNHGISDLFVAQSNIASIDTNVDAPSYAIKGNGVRILAESADMATFRFKNIIDLNNVNKDQNIIKILPLSTENYTLTSEIHVKLIDIYDEKNTVEYFAYPMYYPYYPGMPDWSHCFVNYDGRTLARNNDGDNSVRNNYGSAIPAHFNGQMLDGTMRSNVNWIELQVDYTEKQFLCLGYVVNPTQYCILDLDDSNQVGLGKEWKGFKTGEVYMEISFLADGNKSGVLISEIAGQSFSGNAINDQTNPSIIIDSYTKIAPNGSLYKPYKIIQPTSALDLVDGNLDVNMVEITILKRKIYGYYEDVTPLYDGEFFHPNETGDYLIRYKIKDQNGNIGQKDLSFHIHDSLEFSAFISMNDSYFVGETFMINEVEVTCYTSILSREISYSFQNKKLDFNSFDEVTFNEPGELIIQYRFIAFTGDILEGEKKIEIVLNTKPVITSEPINDYVIKGKTLILPNFEAIDYSKKEGSSNRYPEKYYLINGVKIPYENKKYIVTEQAGTALHIQEVSLGSTKDFYVTVIEPKYLSDYFIYDNPNVYSINGKNALEYQFEEDTTFEFVNPLITSNGSGLVLELGLNSSLDTSNAFRMILSDFKNEALSLYLDITFKNGKYYIELNENNIVKEAPTYIKNGETYLRLSLNNISHKITNVFGIDTFSNGKAFDGFKSNLVKMKVSFQTITKKTGFCIYSLAGKSFESYFVDDKLQEYDDISMPSIVYNTSIYDQDLSYGKKIMIPSAQAWNVLSGRYEVSVTVKSSTNKNALYNEDASTPHEITLNEYGTWYVQYMVVSPSGLRKTFTLAILSSNDSIPVYTITNHLKDSYSLKDCIVLPTIQSSEELVINMILIDSNGKYIYVDQGMRYSPTLKGEYRLMIYISNGYHYTVEFYEFEVK